jgi:thiol:disulfide interchange protein DsbD
MKKILFLFALFPLLTAEPITVNTGHAEVSLIKNSKNLQSEDLYIGIKFDLQKNWHTYWKNPGDSGGPLEIKWSLPEGIKLGNINWPSPELIPYPPLMTYGYNDQVVFPFKVAGFELGSQNKKLELVIDFLICADVF